VSDQRVPFDYELPIATDCLIQMLHEMIVFRLIIYFKEYFKFKTTFKVFVKKQLSPKTMHPMRLARDRMRLA